MDQGRGVRAHRKMAATMTTSHSAVAIVASSLSPCRCCMCEGRMRTRCVPSGHNGEHEWASGDDTAVAIIRLRLL